MVKFCVTQRPAIVLFRVQATVFRVQKDTVNSAPYKVQGLVRVICYSCVAIPLCHTLSLLALLNPYPRLFRTADTVSCVPFHVFFCPMKQFTVDQSSLRESRQNKSDVAEPVVQEEEPECLSCGA